MSEKNIVERFADAQPGDWVWLFDSQKAVYDENRKYRGRGDYEAIQVIGRTRSSIVTGRYRETKFDLTTGYERGCKIGVPLQIMGSIDRHEAWWKGRAHQIARLVQDCRDVEKLKGVAFIIGFDEQSPSLSPKDTGGEE